MIDALYVKRVAQCDYSLCLNRVNSGTRQRYQGLYGACYRVAVGLSLLQPWFRSHISIVKVLCSQDRVFYRTFWDA